MARLFKVLLILGVLAIALIASVALLTLPRNSTKASTKVCDEALLSELKLSSTDFCLQNLQITISAKNSSELIVPVMIVKPGTITSLELLYELSGESVQHPGPKQNVTSSELPAALSVPSGIVSDLVKFSDASLVYESSSTVIYNYTLIAPDSSNGYYAIMPPFYFGFYPVLAVGADSNHLNESELSNWGYDGPMISGEFMLPSLIVGTGDATLVNATVPAVQICPSPACNVIAHSGS